MKRSRKHAANAGQIYLVSSWAVESDCEVGVGAIKALRVAPPALRAADGLDRAAFARAGGQGALLQRTTYARHSTGGSSVK